MKILLMTLFSLALTLCVLMPPHDTQAGRNSFKTQCVRFKGDRLVKSGECTGFEGGNIHCYSYFAIFSDDDNMRIDRFCGDCAHDRVDPHPEIISGCKNFLLDGHPAVNQQSSLMGKGWICYEKIGTDEVMCASEKSMCSEWDPGCLDESGSTPATPQRLHLTNTQHLQFMKSSAEYRAADERLTAAWKQVKNRLSPKRFQIALAEQRAWVKTGRNDAASRLSGGLSPVEAFTQVTEERAWELERLAAREGR